MTRLLRTFLIWMLLLALPAQAIASAIKTSCGPTHHSITSTVAAEPQHSHHGMHNADYHHYDVADSTVEGDALPDMSDASGKYKSSFCSACAACCVGAAAIPSQLDWAPVHTGSFISVISPESSFTGHIPAGPERPPRLLLA
jgi:hypothetical protein